MIEMIYHLQLNAALGPRAEVHGRDARTPRAWTAGSAPPSCWLTGLALFELTRREFVREWGEIQEEIEKEIKRRAAL